MLLSVIPGYRPLHLESCLSLEVPGGNSGQRQWSVRARTLMASGAWITETEFNTSLSSSSLRLFGSEASMHNNKCQH